MNKKFINLILIRIYNIDVMKKISTHIYIVAIFFVVTFVMGSFFDYQINDALFHNLDTFGLILSATGTIPGYGVLAFMGGGLLFFGIKRKFPHVAWKVTCLVFAPICLAAFIYFSGKEFFSRNGFYFLDINPLFGYLFVVPVAGGIGYLGYYLTSKTDNENLWKIYLLIVIAITVALVGGVTLLKEIFHRPRFRAIMTSGVAGLDYHPWYVRCANYKDFIFAGVNKEDFKSFPSGHAGTCAVFMMFMVFLPQINKKYQKMQIPCFYIGLAWTLLISFSRMYVGAHYLSDVSMGALLSIACLYAAKVVMEKVKWFSTSETPQIEQVQE